MIDYDEDKVDEAVLALLYLTMRGDKYETRAWKGHDWEAMSRLHEKGYIGDPRSAAKSVLLSKRGQAKSAEAFRRLFGMSKQAD